MLPRLTKWEMHRRALHIKWETPQRALRMGCKRQVMYHHGRRCDWDYTLEYNTYKTVVDWHVSSWTTD
jgi:hypothetical protein